MLCRRRRPGKSSGSVCANDHPQLAGNSVNIALKAACRFSDGSVASLIRTVIGVETREGGAGVNAGNVGFGAVFYPYVFRMLCVFSLYIHLMRRRQVNARLGGGYFDQNLALQERKSRAHPCAV